MPEGAENHYENGPCIRDLEPLRVEVMCRSVIVGKISCVQNEKKKRERKIKEIKNRGDRRQVSAET